MKKLISLILAFSVVLTLSACSTSDADSNESKVQATDIVGEWIAVNANASITLNEDGTGEFEFNGTQSVTWSFNAETQRFTVTGDGTYDVEVGNEYDMPYLNMLDMDFYHFDDYDKAYTLLISRRCEDIVDFTIDMTEIKLNTPYDLANGITIQFTELVINENSSPKTLQMLFSISNDRNEGAEDLSLTIGGRYYLADYPLVLDEQNDVVVINTIGANEMAYGTISFSLEENPAKTLELYGRLIGVVYMEMYGGRFYIDLGDLFV